MNEKLKAESWDDSSLPAGTNLCLPNCDATFSYEVSVDRGGGYTVESTGNCDQAQRTVSCSLELRGPFDAAIFTQRDLHMKNGARVGWYNYDADDRNMQIGTNSTRRDSIVFKRRSIIDGDIFVGMGGDPDDVIDDHGATINGSTFALTQVYELPPVTVPESLESLPSLGTIDDDTTIGSSARYESIELGNREVVTISGDITLYVAGDIILGNRAELGVENDASLVLYLAGDIEGKNSSAINNETQDPKRLKIYGLDTCRDIEFKNGTDFYGAIYAPNADVTVHNSGDLYGAVTAKSFKQKNSGNFDYDASLRDTSKDDEAVYFTITNWREGN
jgi:hypothetical protein